MSNIEKMLTVDEVAKILCLHPKSIYRLVQAGKIPCIRIGRSIRFSPDVVAQLTKGEG